MVYPDIWGSDKSSFLMDDLKEKKYAKKQIINATWVMEYEQLNQDNIKINRIYRDDMLCYKPMPKYELIETPDRTVTHARINDYTYNVKNRKHIFDYNK